MAQDLGTEADRKTEVAEPTTKTEQVAFRPPPRSGNGAVKVIFGLLVVIAIAAGGFYWWAYSSTYESTDDAQIDGNIYPVSARISGRVTEVRFRDNQQVKAGDVLVQLDPTDYRVALQRAQADVAQAQAEAQAAQARVPITSTTTASQTSTAGASVEEASAGIAVAQQQYEASLARVREAEANAVKAQKDVERYRPLAEKQEISQQQFDQAVANARALAATVDTAKASADAAQRMIAQNRAKLSVAQAQQSATKSAPQQIAADRARAASMGAAIGVHQAALEQARLNLQYTSVLAPVTGVAGQKSVQVGQQIQAGQELLSIIPLNDIFVTANFKESQIRHMRVGQPVKVKVDSTGKEYDGHVESFPGATGSRYSLLPPENATGNYVKVVQRLPVKIVLENGVDPDHLLRPGMSAEPKVLLK